MSSALGGRALCLVVVLVWGAARPFAAPAVKGCADTAFVQETHEPFPIAPAGPANDVRAVAVADSGTVWAATKAGVFFLAPGARTWQQPKSGLGPSPAFAVCAVGKEQVFVGAWNGLYWGDPDGLARVPGIDEPIAALARASSAPPAASGAPSELFAAGPDGLWRVKGATATRQPLPCTHYVRALLGGDNGDLWLATAMGLCHLTATGATNHQPGNGRLSPDFRDAAYGPKGTLWAGGLGGVAVYRLGGARGLPARAGGRPHQPSTISHKPGEPTPGATSAALSASLQLVNYLTPAKGLPHAAVQCLGLAPDGRMWIGTQLGVARYDGQHWSLRHSRRWLLSDEVRDVAFDKDGSAWLATAAGVSCLRRQLMTLAQKAAHYHSICAARHLRPPGLVEKCRLRVPGDPATYEPQDDDNEGGYTAVYMAMESFRYAVTKDPSALANARRAFNALRFLQTVTETPGLVARTVIPADWPRMHDPNEEIADVQWAEEHAADPRNKRVAVRWRKSADGRWLWKGDTSSDEITAHLFGCFFYHELAADAPERARVREQVCRLVDYLADNGFVLKDTDGSPTRWGVWAPERLNHDPDWAMEAGVNSVELLSFLKLAHHLSGQAKYQTHYERLLLEHNYQANVMRAKNLDPAWRTHIDDELLAFAWPALLTLEKDPALRRLYRQALDKWHDAVKDDHQPFFEFLFAGLTGRRGNLARSLEFLRDQPLDLARWTVDNSRREDLKLVRRPELEHLQTDRLLPPSERGVPRTDENPWRAVQGDGGGTESDGVFWLLPYWMGRYYGLIQPPGSGPSGS
jgi:hypothetical protein